MCAHVNTIEKSMKLNMVNKNQTWPNPFKFDLKVSWSSSRFVYIFIIVYVLGGSSQKHAYLLGAK